MGERALRGKPLGRNGFFLADLRTSRVRWVRYAPYRVTPGLARLPVGGQGEDVLGVCPRRRAGQLTEREPPLSQ